MYIYYMYIYIQSDLPAACKHNGSNDSATEQLSNKQKGGGVGKEETKGKKKKHAHKGAKEEEKGEEGLHSEKKIDEKKIADQGDGEGVGGREGACVAGVCLSVYV
jgi:hypothetical protein